MTRRFRDNRGCDVFQSVGVVKALRIAVAALATSFLGDAIAVAQAPVHQHYERNDAMHQPGPAGVLAPRLQNLGTHTFKVTTKSARAQQFVNQGLNLAYGFNHACLLYTSPSPRDGLLSRMPSSA